MIALIPWLITVASATPVQPRGMINTSAKSKITFNIDDITKNRTGLLESPTALNMLAKRL